MRNFPYYYFISHLVFLITCRNLWSIFDSVEIRTCSSFTFVLEKKVEKPMLVYPHFALEFFTLDPHVNVDENSLLVLL